MWRTHLKSEVLVLWSFPISFYFCTVFFLNLKTKFEIYHNNACRMANNVEDFSQFGISKEVCSIFLWKSHNLFLRTRVFDCLIWFWFDFDLYFRKRISLLERLSDTCCSKPIKTRGAQLRERNSLSLLRRIIISGTFLLLSSMRLRTSLPPCLAMKWESFQGLSRHQNLRHALHKVSFSLAQFMHIIM